MEPCWFSWRSWGRSFSATMIVIIGINTVFLPVWVCGQLVSRLSSANTLSSAHFYHYRGLLDTAIILSKRKSQKKLHLWNLNLKITGRYWGFKEMPAFFILSYLIYRKSPRGFVALTSHLAASVWRPVWDMRKVLLYRYSSSNGTGVRKLKTPHKWANANKVPAFFLLLLDIAAHNLCFLGVAALRQMADTHALCEPQHFCWTQPVAAHITVQGQRASETTHANLATE